MAGELAHLERRDVAAGGAPAWLLDLVWAAGCTAIISGVLVAQCGIWARVNSSDLHAHILPWYELSGRSLLGEGRLALWNPYIFSGTPFLGKGETGALYAPEFRALIVADLHLEKGTSLARRGVHLPPYDTRQSLMQLRAAIGGARPERLIFLGDSFHDGGARERIDADDLAVLRAITAGVVLREAISCLMSSISRFAAVTPHWIRASAR